MDPSRHKWSTKMRRQEENSAKTTCSVWQQNLSSALAKECTKKKQSSDSPPLSTSMVFLRILVNTDNMTVSVTLDRPNDFLHCCSSLLPWFTFLAWCDVFRGLLVVVPSRSSCPPFSTLPEHHSSQVCPLSDTSLTGFTMVFCLSKPHQG